MPTLVRRSSYGFTLIELLITISIIVLLAGLSMVSFGGVQKQARDTQRKSDLKQYTNALVSYGAKNKGFFPSRTGTTPAATTLCTTDLVLTTCPADPKNVAPYIYNYISNGTNGGTATATTYALWTGLEDVGSATFWVVCSNGKSNKTATAPTAGTICPL